MLTLLGSSSRIGMRTTIELPGWCLATWKSPRWSYEIRGGRRDDVASPNLACSPVSSTTPTRPLPRLRVIAGARGVDTNTGAIPCLRRCVECVRWDGFVNSDKLFNVTTTSANTSRFNIGNLKDMSLCVSDARVGVPLPGKCVFCAAVARVCISCF